MKYFLLSVFLFCAVAWSENKPYVERTSQSASFTPNIERIPQNIPLTPKVDYGQIFIQETHERPEYPFSISLFGGQEIGSPYIHSSFFGVEVKHRIHSFLHLGLEYSLHDSKSHSAVLAIEKKMDLYGLDLAYPFLKNMVYVNWHYSFFKSHVNLVSLFRINVDFPVQFGFGVMNMAEKGRFLSVKWGIGPHVHLSHRLGIQIRFSQTVSVSKNRFLYTWYSFNFIYNL